MKKKRPQVRERGPRRRVSDSLVRTRPALLPVPPPIPLRSWIARVMRPTIISDYEGLSTAAWSTGGTTGRPGSANATCIYKLITTANQQIESVEYILDPIRWAIAAPSSDGGSYDFWVNRAGFTAHKRPLLRYGSDQFGKIGITNTLLPSGSHGIWQEGFSLINPSQLYPWRCEHNLTSVDYTKWIEVNLSNIEASTQSWGAAFGFLDGGIRTNQIAAIRHRVNGSPVGSLILNPNPNHLVDPAWRVSVSADDTYELDVWYRIGSQANSSFSPIPAKGCVYFPQTAVASGAELVAGSIQFENVDFSPSFNFQEETYRVTIAGHSDWTLKDGSDGPHKIVTGGGWTAVIGAGELRWIRDSNTDYVSEIRLYWDREIVHAELLPGPLMSTGTGAALYYRAVSTGEYRANTSAPWLGGTVTHADSGLFDQAGTTTFSFVDWSLPLNNPGGGQFAEGFLGSAPPLPGVDVPTSISFTRVLM